MKKIKEENGRGQVLTIGTAKALIGKTIETYMQGFVNQSYRNKFVVGDIMSEYDYYKTLDEDCFPDASGHRNRAELWDEIMSDTQLARVQNKMLLLNGEGKRTGIYANRYVGSDDSLRFQRSDDGRWTWFVWFVEAQ